MQKASLRSCDECGILTRGIWLHQGKFYCWKCCRKRKGTFPLGQLSRIMSIKKNIKPEKRT